MRISRISLLVFFLVSMTTQAQIPAKISKMEGVWKYKEGSGYEVWEKKGDQLAGYTFRLNKVGDTSKVDDIVLKMVNKRLMYSLKTYTYVHDSLKIATHNFLGGKRKMKFVNIDIGTPYSIHYSFGFLNRNKLKLSIQYGANDTPIKLVLFRVKAT